MSTPREKFVDRINKLLFALQDVNEAWPAEDGPGSEGYPFSACFNELQGAVCDWRDKQQDLVNQEKKS